MIIQLYMYIYSIHHPHIDINRQGTQAGDPTMDVDEDPTTGDIPVESDPSTNEPDLPEPLDPDVNDDNDLPQQTDPPTSSPDLDLPDPDIVLDDDGNVVPGNNTSPLIVDVGGAEAGQTVGEGNPAVSIITFLATIDG